MHVSVRMFGIHSDGMYNICVLSECSCLRPLVHRVVVVLGATLVDTEIIDIESSVEMLFGMPMDDWSLHDFVSQL